MNNFEQKIYIHSNFNKNEIRNVLLQRSNTELRPTPTEDDKGLLYYDTDIDRPLVWNGKQWKIVKYLDDRDIGSNEDVKIKDIWLDIKGVADLSESDAKLSNDYVEHKENIELTNISGTWEWKSTELKSPVLPKEFPDGTIFENFYEPILTKQNGNVIPRLDSNGNDIWQLISIRNDDWSWSYRVRFFKKISGISQANPPSITYYKYIGRRLSSTFSGALIDKQVYSGNEGTQSLSPDVFFLPIPTFDGQILSIMINGVEINKNYYSLDSNGLTIETSLLEYQIESTDYIFVNLLI